MLWLICYESTKLDRKTWLDVPSGVPAVAYDVMCTVHFFGVYLHPSKDCYSYYLSFNLKRILNV